MAAYPTDKGSPGTWGAECRAYHAVSTDLDTGKIKDGAVQVSSAAPTVDAALANKKYVDDGGVKAVNGTPTQVFTKYLTGSLDGAATTNVAHGITGVDNILSVSAMAFNDAVSQYTTFEAFREESVINAFIVTFDGTNIIFGSVGANIQSNKYRIRIDYIL